MLQIKFLFFLLIVKSVSAQDYRALHGSPYGGSLTVYNNPASINHVPYAWDISPIGIHVKQSTNGIAIQNSSVFSPAKNAKLTVANGVFERFFMANQDVRILNGRIRINEVSAIAFGAGIRGYEYIKASPYNWQDSMKDVRAFMEGNENNVPINSFMNTNAWTEVYGTYSRNIFDNENGILNAGLTVKINKGLAGAYLSASNLGFQLEQPNNNTAFILNGGELNYGYSSNFDEFDNGGTDAEKRKRFMKKTWASIGVSLGAEYIIPSTNADGNYYDYDFKLGISLLDFGRNKFQYGANSTSAILSKGIISDSLLEAKFKDIRNFDDAPDSIQSLAGSFSILSGGFFRINQPTRVVINADKKIAENLFINGELVLPLAEVIAKDKFFVKEINLVSITPRYESNLIGFYLPTVITNRGQFWVGGALRAGPLLLGVHNWSNIFSKSKMQNGGMYLALTFRPSNKKNKGEENNYGKERNGKRSKKYGCPVVR